jgi:hypothetical protein
MKNLNSRLFYLAVFSLVILFFIEIFTHYDTTTRQTVLAITDVSGLIILLVVYFVLKKKMNIEFPWYVAWFAASGIWFDAAGNFARLYAKIIWWDKLAHGVGSAAVAAALFFILYQLNQQEKIKLGGFNLCLYTLSLTTFFSAVYEVSEYLGDKMSTSQRVTDLFDTADDLLWNIIAAFLAIMIAYFLAKIREKRVIK